MFLPSTGLRCGTTFTNDGTFSSGTMITVPDSCVASIVVISFSSAMIDAYSVPCAPASRASTGPAFAPCATAIGIDSAASLPAGTSMDPGGGLAARGFGGSNGEDALIARPRLSRHRVRPRRDRNERDERSASSLCGADVVVAGPFLT